MSACGYIAFFIHPCSALVTDVAELYTYDYVD